MPVDHYTPCPGGCDKKIKFCCPDLLGELQKIERMLEGEQNIACLNHIEQLQKQEPDRACLLALKGMLYRALGQWDEFRANAATFVEKHPENPSALAESAIAAAPLQGGSAAVGILQGAIAACDGGIRPRVYEAIGIVAQVLLSEGQWLAGRALLQLQTAIHQDDERPVEMLIELNRSADVPLLLKDDPVVEPCPEDAPWKDRFEEAVAPVASGNWQAAAGKLAALTEEIPDSPTIWRNLATLRGWLADTSGCTDALRKYAATEDALEDAVEAEARAMLLAESPLGDPLEILAVNFPIKEVEHFQAGLALESRVVEFSLDPSAMGDDDTPPPRATYMVLDHPIPEKAEGLALQTVPRLLAQAMLYGRQTDCEARLEVVGVSRDDLEQVQTVLEETAADAIDLQSGKEEVIARTSASHQLLQRNWRLPRDATAEQLAPLAAAHTRDALLERWPQLKLGIFQGRSPAEVAGDESCRVRLLAAMMVLESWGERVPSDFDFNQLRSRLGLPVLEPVNPSDEDIQSVPLVRLSRVTVEQASDEDLCLGYRRAVAFGATAAQQKYARAILDRTSLAGSTEQLSSYRTLAETEADSEKALQYIEQGRSAAESAGQSCALWDLMELSFRFARGDASHLQRLVEHLQARHIEEPGVAEALTQFLVGAGAIHPDGTPVQPPPREEPPMAAGVESSDESRKLWTPDSEQPGGGKKLWTPD